MCQRWSAWCPSGCGKSVYYGYTNKVNNERRFICDRCKRTWANKQVLLKSQEEVGL